MKLENVFRRIHPNSANLVHGRSPLSEIIHTTSFWHIDAVGGRPHQQQCFGRVKDAEALRGRDRMREALRNLGFELR